MYSFKMIDYKLSTFSRNITFFTDQGLRNFIKKVKRKKLIRFKFLL